MRKPSSVVATAANLLPQNVKRSMLHCAPNSRGFAQPHHGHCPQADRLDGSALAQVGAKVTKALLGEVLSKLSSKGDILRIQEAADLLRTLFSRFSNVLEHGPFSACCVQCHAVRSRPLTVLGPGCEAVLATGPHSVV